MAVPARLMESEAERWSFSKLDTYQKCPHAWYQVYRLGRRGPDTGPTLLGRTVHSILEELAKWRSRQALVYEERRMAMELTVKLFQEAQAAAPGLLEAGDLDVIRDMVEAARLWLPSALTDYDVERHLVREADGITFHGYADLIHRVPGRPPLILDWKTGRHVYAPEETQQLGLYSWMLGEERTTVRLVFLREGRALEAEVVRAEAEEAGAWAVGLVREILAKGDDPAAFEPRPNGLCAWCHLREECPAAGEWVAPGVIATLEEAQAEARRLLVQEAVVKGRRDALAKWAKANGIFTAEGQEFGCFPTKELEADPKAVVEVAELLGFGPEVWAALSLASAKAESLARRHPELAGLIAWKERPGYFRHRRASSMEGDGAGDS